MTYPPPWQDKTTLCRHVCSCPRTVDKWVLEGILPPPRRMRGRLMWKWSEVDEYLSRHGSSPEEALAERVKNGTRREQANSRG